jgi:hypothetical protein
MSKAADRKRHQPEEVAATQDSESIGRRDRNTHLLLTAWKLFLESQRRDERHDSQSSDPED